MLSLIVPWRVLYAGDLTVLFSLCHAPASAPSALTVPALPAGYPLPNTGLYGAVFLSSLFLQELCQLSAPMLPFREVLLAVPALFISCGLQ